MSHRGEVRYGFTFKWCHYRSFQLQMFGKIWESKWEPEIVLFCYCKVHIFWEGHKILRNLCPMYCQSNNWWRFWPSQNIWSLTKTISCLQLRSQILQNAKINIVMHWKFWRKYWSVQYWFSCWKKLVTKINTCQLQFL